MRILHVEDEAKKASTVRRSLEDNKVLSTSGFAELELVTSLDTFKARFASMKPDVIISDGSFPVDSANMQATHTWQLLIAFLREQNFQGKLIINTASSVSLAPYEDSPFVIVSIPPKLGHQIAPKLKEWNCELDPEFAKTKIDEIRLTSLRATLVEISKLEGLKPHLTDNESYWLSDCSFVPPNLSDAADHVFFLENFNVELFDNVRGILMSAHDKLESGELKDNVLRLSNELATYIPNKISVALGIASNDPEIAAQQALGKAGALQQV